MYSDYSQEPKNRKQIPSLDILLIKMMVALCTNNRTTIQLSTIKDMVSNMGN